jgi:16S rRNA (cytidine1402-2'-O)-methyltransferase
MKQELPPLQAGTLYLVATPIGNLEDITLRALRVLRECDVIAAEDTRHTGQLLQAFAIRKPLLSYFKFNEARRSEEIIDRLKRGEKIALVTDAGTPGISDPGERVVRAALEAGCRVESVPGPCALVSGLTASGLDTEEFHFSGFLYESPYRIGKLLDELAEVMPDRKVVLARELTKKFEEYLRGTPKELAEIYQKRVPKGEFVVMVAGTEDRPTASAPATAPVVTVGALIRNGEGHVLMVRTHKWSDLWGIPGGKIKQGETAEAALHREIMEETALEVSDIRFVLVQDCIESAEFYRPAHFVLLNYTCRAGDGEVRLNEEAEEYRWIAPAEAMKLPLNSPTRTLLEAVS